MLNRRYFSRASKIVFLSLKNFWVLSTSFINICSNFTIGLWSVVHARRPRNFVLSSSQYFFVIYALLIAALCCWKIHSSPHSNAFLVREINHLASSHSVLLFVDHWQSITTLHRPHHIMLSARISLTLSLSSIASYRSSGLHDVSAQSSCM